MKDQIVGEVVLTATTKLVFSVRKWNGRPFASVRKFVSSQKYEGWTKSGFSMTPRHIDALVDALDSLDRSFPPKDEHEFMRVPRRDGQYLRIATMPSSDEGLPFVDLREYVDTQNYQGPTKSGVRFRWNLLPDVCACLREQGNVLREMRNEQVLLEDNVLLNAAPPNESSTAGKHANEVTDLLGEIVRSFPLDFLHEHRGEGRMLNLPDAPLRLHQDNAGSYQLCTDEGNFCPVRNSVEADFIIYAQLRGDATVVIPAAMIDVFKAVKSYESYVRAVQKRLVARIMQHTSQYSVAEYEARRLMVVVGLPWLS